MGILIALIFSFFNFGVNQYEEPEHIKVADVICKDVGDRIAARYEMKIVGDYGALFDQINELGFRFQVVGPKAKEQLREILIDCTEDLVSTVNRASGIERHLGSYPFRYDQVNVAIFLVDEKRYAIHYPLIGTASVVRGKIRYCTDEKGVLGYKTVEVESYEEALKLARGNSE